MAGRHCLSTWPFFARDITISPTKGGSGSNGAPTGRWSLLDGGHPGGAARLVCGYGFVVALDQADFVEAVDQAIAIEGVDLESIGESIAAYLLLLQVDGHHRGRVLRGEVDQVADLAFGQGHCEQAGLVAVGAE